MTTELHHWIQDLEILGLFGTLDDILPERPPATDELLDRHNVHDSGVVQSFASCIHSMSSRLDEEGAFVYTMPFTKQLFLSRVFNTLCPLPYDVRINALQTFETIRKQNELMVCLNMRESDIFCIVMTYICIFYNEKDVVDIIDHMIERLADAIEENEVVCAMGRMLRLLDTLNTIDSNVNIVPSNILRKEMQYRCYTLYRQFQSSQDLEKGEGVPRQELEDGEITINDYPDFGLTSPQSSSSIQQHSQRYKFEQQALQVLTSEYVDTGIMTLSSLEHELSLWLHDIV